jgi:UDP-glucuronate 4-epimerase
LKLLLTGGAGFIGSAVVNRLIRRRDLELLAVIDNFDPFYDPAIKRRRWAEWESNGNILRIEGDIRDERTMDRIFKAENWEAVLHLAAVPGVRPSLRDPARYVDVNVKGTVQLLQSAAARGIPKFVFLSSSSVYGEVPPGKPVREEDAASTPVSPYAASKRSAELFCRTFHELYGLNCAVIRPFTVYGPGQRPDMALYRFAKRMLEGEPLPVYQPESSRDYTYVDDVAGAILLALDRCRGYREYNIGSGSPVSLLRMVDLLAEHLGVCPKIEVIGAQQGDVTHTWADITRAREELGFEPSVSPEEGVRRFTAWFLKEFARGPARKGEEAAHGSRMS